MILSGKAKFLSVKEFTPKKEGSQKLTFVVLGFDEDYDRREVLVPKEMLMQIPGKDNVYVNVKLQIEKRYDGKEEVRLLDLKVAAA